MKEVIKDDYVALEMVGKAYVLDTQYEKAFETDVTKRVIKAFRDNRILPPAVLHRAVDAPRYETPRVGKQRAEA
jgi:hypothetical protein